MTHPSSVSHNISPYTFATELTANDSSAKDMKGIVRAEYDSTYGLCKYVYVMNNSGTALADGDACVYNDSYGFKVSSTHSVRNKHAGVAFGTITASYYGWIQTYGYHDAIKGSTLGAIAAGDSMIMSASAKKVARSAAGSAATYQQFGVAMANDSTTSLEGRIMVMLP